MSSSAPRPTNGAAGKFDLRPTPLLPDGFAVPASRWTHPSAQLRRALDARPYIFAPGVYDPYTAQLVMYYGFPAAYFSGYSFAMGHVGSTDMDLYSSVEIADAARRTVSALRKFQLTMAVGDPDAGVEPHHLEIPPLVVDMDGGYGNAFNFSSSFKWHADPDPISFVELGELGYRFIFITLAAIHANGLGFSELLTDLAARDEQAYINVQRREWSPDLDLPSRSHHLFSGVPYHHLLGSVYGAARLSREVADELREETAVEQERRRVADSEPDAEGSSGDARRMARPRPRPSGDQWGNAAR